MTRCTAHQYYYSTASDEDSRNQLPQQENLDFVEKPVATSASIPWLGRLSSSWWNITEFTSSIWLQTSPNIASCASYYRTDYNEWSFEASACRSTTIECFPEAAVLNTENEASNSSSVASCLPCFKLKAAASQWLMGQLPLARVTVARPFVNVGIDYVGPFEIKSGNTRSRTTTKFFV